MRGARTAARAAARRRHGRLAGAEAEVRTPALCAPRWGNRVLRSTKPGVAAIFGIPVCWCAGGAGWRVTSVVVAPGAACTTVGATGLTGAADSDGLATMLRLLESSGAGLPPGSLALGRRAGTVGQGLALALGQRLIGVPLVLPLLVGQLLGLLEVEPGLRALLRAQSRPFGHARLHALLFARRHLRIAAGQVQPFGLARRVDRRPVGRAAAPMPSVARVTATSRLARRCRRRA